MARFRTAMANTAKHVAHLLLLLLLLCGVLYITGCPRCKPEYKPLVTEDEENATIYYRRLHYLGDSWIQEIDDSDWGGNGMQGLGGTPGGSLTPD